MARKLIIIVFSALILVATIKYAWVAGSVGSGAFASAELIQEKEQFEGNSYTTTRRKILVPPEYGTLVNISGRGDGGATLWFAQSGTIRNVIVGDGPVIIQREGSVSY